MRHPWIDIEEFVTASMLFFGSAIVSCVLVFGVHGIQEVRAEPVVAVEVGPSLVLDVDQLPSGVTGRYEEGGREMAFRVTAATENRPHMIFVSNYEGPVFAQVTSQDGVLVEMVGGADDLLGPTAAQSSFFSCRSIPCRVDVLRMFEHVQVAAPSVYTALQMHRIGSGLGTLLPSS